MEDDMEDYIRDHLEACAVYDAKFPSLVSEMARDGIIAEQTDFETFVIELQKRFSVSPSLRKTWNDACATCLAWDYWRSRHYPTTK